MGITLFVFDMKALNFVTFQLAYKKNSGLLLF